MTLLSAGQLSYPDWFILIGYFALMLGIGGYFYRHMRAVKDYFSGGNQIPWWLSGVSFYMSSFSVFAFVFYSSLAYQYGFVAVTLFWVTVPATLVSAIFFSSRWRRARIDSPVEYLESRYGPAVRQLFAWQGVPVRVIDDALKIIAIGMFISIGLGMDMKVSMLGAGLIMLIYTFMGGLWAVTVTDFIQFIVMVAAMAILLPLSIAEVGGISGFVKGTPADFFRFTHPEYGWVYVGCQLLLYCLVYSSTGWQLIQRYLCVPRERDALKVGWLVVGLNIVGPPVMFIPAMAARQFLTGVENTGQVYPLLCAHLLPVGMLGLVTAAMFSATMSMLSSDYNVTASVLTNDVYRRLFRPEASQRELVFIGRAMTLAVGIVSLGVAFGLARGGGEQQFRNMVKLFSVATAPVAIPMMLGLLWRRMTNRGALAGFLGGVGVGLALFIWFPDEKEMGGITWKKENVLLLSTAAVTLVAMIAVSLSERASASARERTEDFHRRLSIPIGELPEDSAVLASSGEVAMSPFRVVGISTGLIGMMMLAVLPWVEGRLAIGMNMGVALALCLFGGIVSYRSGLFRSTREDAL